MAVAQNENTFKDILRNNSVSLSIWILGALFSALFAAYNLSLAYKLTPLVQDISLLKQAQAQIERTEETHVGRTEFSQILERLDKMSDRLDQVYQIHMR